MRNTAVRIFVLLCITMIFALPAQAKNNRQLPDFSALVKRVQSAVVNISTSNSPNGSYRGDLAGDGAKLSPEEFLKRYLGDRGNNTRNRKRSLGSGFIISSDGYILSNNHVIRGATRIVVRLNDRRVFLAKVIGTDKRSDIALLKINARDLPTVKIGRSSKLQVGEWVLAIGSPFGFDYSVTAGIVSATARSLPRDSYVPFIQTDVAINPGNSGGPLFNLKGEVIGINSQIFSRTGGYMGLSFAIPIDMAMDVVKQLKSKGKVTRGWLGIYIEDVTLELSEAFGMAKPIGALVTKVVPGGPGDKAGLKRGDIIVAFNGKTINMSSHLPPVVGRTEVGKKIRMDVVRLGKRIVRYVVLGSLKDQRRASGVTGNGVYAYDARLQFGVRQAPDELRNQLSLGDSGLLVIRVGPGPAYLAGLRKGDVISRIGATRLLSVAQFRSVIANLVAGRVRILVHRQGGTRWITVDVP